MDVSKQFVMRIEHQVEMVSCVNKYDGRIVWALKFCPVDFRVGEGQHDAIRCARYNDRSLIEMAHRINFGARCRSVVIGDQLQILFFGYSVSHII